MRSGSCRAGVNAVFNAGSPAAAVVNSSFISGGGRSRLRRRPRRRGSRSPRRSARASAPARGRPACRTAAASRCVPVVATRIAMNRSPAFQPRASTSSRSGGSSSSASQVTASWAAQALAGRREGLGRGRGVPALGHDEGRVDRRARRRHRKPDQVDDRGQGRQPLADDRQQRPELVLGGAPVDLAVGRPPPRGTGSSRSTRSSSSSRRIHWPLSHSSRSRSKRAPPFWTFSMLEALLELVEREDLLLGARRPAEEREVVDERLLDEALRDVVGDRRLALALRSSWCRRG